MQHKPLVTDDEILKNIERLYKDHQSFVFHMIRSIYPIKKVKRVKSFWEIQNKLRMCCFSNQRLVDLKNIADNVSQKDGTSSDLLLDIFIDRRTPVQVVELNIKNERRLALVGENSDKMFSLQGYTVFCGFLKSKINEGDQKLARVLVNSFISYYLEDIKKNFDLSISWNVLGQKTKDKFVSFVSDRNLPGISISFKFIWECCSGRRH